MRQSYKMIEVSNQVREVLFQMKLSNFKIKLKINKVNEYKRNQCQIQLNLCYQDQ